LKYFCGQNKPPVSSSSFILVMIKQHALHAPIQQEGLFTHP
jgi:hypothetical protein